MTDVAKIQRWEKKKGKWCPWPSEEVLLGLAASIHHQDRIQHLAASLGMPRQDLMDAIRLYSDRNEAVHGPPPTIDKNIKDDGKIDWVSIRAQCEAKKTSLEADFLAGKITEEQREKFHFFINEWLRLHLRGGDIPSKNAVGKRNKGRGETSAESVSELLQGWEVG
jgi:hypothetical protein